MNRPLENVRTEQQAALVSVQHLDPVALGLLIDAVEAKAQRARAEFMQNLVRQLFRYIARKLTAAVARPGVQVPAHAK